MTTLKYLLVLIFILVILAFSVLFSVQNDVRVPLDLLVWRFGEHRLALWVLSAFTLGGLFGLLVSSMAIIHLRTARMRLNRHLRAAEAEVQQLRVAAAK